jgi:hypothetical protein
VADFISFSAGRAFLANGGLPATCYFLLSTKPCSGTGTHVVGDTLAGGVGEITGTGYTRQSQAEPTATTATPASVVFTQMTWNTGAATNWPASVKSCVLATTSDNSGVALCAWNLQAGGTARNMAAASTLEQFTPTLNLA